MATKTTTVTAVAVAISTVTSTSDSSSASNDDNSVLAVMYLLHMTSVKRQEDEYCVSSSHNCTKTMPKPAVLSYDFNLYIKLHYAFCIII